MPLIAAGLLCSTAQAQVTFTDVAVSAGVAELSYGKSAGMADLDGDGKLDLVAINADSPNQFYRQLSGGTFVETSVAWGLLPDLKQHLVGLIADFDNDGDADVYVASGGFVKTQENQVLRNDLSTTGVFTDFSTQSLDGNIASQNFGATTGDFDNDGDLDIFLSNSAQAKPCVVLSNMGSNTYKDVTLSVGVAEFGVYAHCTSGDFDNDGWVDVAVGNLVGNNLLYRNVGNGYFVDIAKSVGVASMKDNFGLVFEDFDNDGNLDLFVPKFNNLLPATHPTEIFLNNLTSFVNVSAALGVTAQTDMGHNTGDLNGDGYPDIMIGTGHPDFKSPNIMYLVTPDGSGGILLNDVSQSSGFLAGGDTRTHGTAIGDYNQDGFVDVFVNNGGPATDPLAQEPHYLLQGADNGTHWAGFELEGVLSNRSAVGAHLIAKTSTGREVHRRRRVGQGFGNSDSPIQHVGIGSDASIELLTIRWPSGIVQTLVKPALATVHQVVETGLVLNGPTTLGGQVDLNLVGPVDQKANLYFCGSTIELPLPGFGMLRLMPPLTPIGSVQLDPTGRGTASIPIPANPSLLGLKVYLQGWFFDPLTFGNSALSNTVEVLIK